MKAELDEVRGDSAPTLNEFKRGRTCTKDKARSARLVEVTEKDIINRIRIDSWYPNGRSSC